MFLIPIAKFTYAEICKPIFFINFGVYIRRYHILLHLNPTGGGLGMQRKLFHIFLSSLVILLIISGAVIAASYVPVYINGHKLESDVSPQIINGRTMVPMGVIADAFGAEVTWVEASKSVEIISPAQKFLDDYGDNNMFISNANSMLLAYNAGKAVILDVRPETLRIQSHITGSLHIPMPELVERMSELPKDKLIGVYCAKNINASYAVVLLNMQGYKAFLLENGITAWKTAGGAVTTDSSCLP